MVDIDEAVVDESALLEGVIRKELLASFERL